MVFQALASLFKRDATHVQSADAAAKEVDDLVAKFKMRAGNDDAEDGETEGAPRKTKHFVDTNRFNLVIGVVIFVNALTMGMETDARGAAGPDGEVSMTWYILELTFCVIFLTELGIRLCVHGLQFFVMPGAKAWNVTDFLIVTMSVVDTFLLTPLGTGANIRFVQMLRFARLARLVRLIRLFKIFKELWLVASGLIESLKTLTWVCFMLFGLCYVFGILLTLVVGHNDELYDEYFKTSGGWDHEVYFRTVMRSVFTLFQVLTLDNWSEDIARHVVQEQTWLFIVFVFFISLGSFGLLNIIVAVVVENTLSTSEKDQNYVKQKKERFRQTVFSQLREIFEYADLDRSGTLTIDEVEAALDKPEVYSKLKMIDFPVEDPGHMFRTLDWDDCKELTIDEFITGCMRMKGSAKSKDLLVAQVALDTLRKHHDTFEEEMSLFNKKVRHLDATARALIEHGEHVFLNAQEYRLRHPAKGGPHKDPPKNSVTAKLIEKVPWISDTIVTHVFEDEDGEASEFSGSEYAMLADDRGPREAAIAPMEKLAPDLHSGVNVRRHAQLQDSPPMQALEDEALPPGAISDAPRGPPAGMTEASNFAVAALMDRS
eukprot:TRINITY_DN29467_c0_g1_i1.p1 TRINITY_DN29467_c0_g1~~TRINITY_DN29467_c0_g1_i1.p1  ORF type:complete len:601 (-),score=177.66 TRINITY_DN29467_c0_g1_i1:174-1976(-)